MIPVYLFHIRILYSYYNIQNLSNVHEPATRVDPEFSIEGFWIDQVDL